MLFSKSEMRKIRMRPYCYLINGYIICGFENKSFIESTHVNPLKTNLFDIWWDNHSPNPIQRNQTAEKRLVLSIGSGRKLSNKMYRKIKLKK
ncbi:hypothetical protein DESC_500007 [Desulfosarcina cetonica]|nr:hypothetical protein DESC_500007 [Desulfosarcina cetonica]